MEMFEEQKEKRLKKSNWSPKGLMGHNKGGKYTNYGSPRKRYDKVTKRLFEEIIAKNLLNERKDMTLLIQELNKC